MDDSQVERMRERARQMRRAAGMTHNPEIIDILCKVASEADADAAALEAELQLQVQHLPSQT